MVAEKTISIAFPTNRDGALTHRIRNFGEDLWREIERTGLGSLGGSDAIDRAADSLVIRIKLNSNIRRVRKIVGRILAAHSLASDAEVTYS